MTASTTKGPYAQIVIPAHVPGNVWVTVTKEHAGVHVVPTHDTFPHYAFDCACQPMLIDNEFQHNSFDGREQFADKTRKPS